MLLSYFMVIFWWIFFCILRISIDCVCIFFWVKILLFIKVYKRKKRGSVGYSYELFVYELVFFFGIFCLSGIKIEKSYFIDYIGCVIESYRGNYI